MSYSDKEICHQLQNDDKDILKYLFDSYYENLVRFAISLISNNEVGEEIAQDVFVNIWNNRKQFSIESSLKAYLFTSVRNRSINHLKSKYEKIKHQDISKIRNLQTGSLADQDIQAEQLQEIISEAIAKLPEKCKIIFNLSRNSDLTYNEIAEKLSISNRTVQAQIGIAIKRIKEHLNNHWEYIPIKNKNI